MTFISSLGWIWGEMIFSLEAYFIRDWFPLQLTAYVPVILVLGLHFLIPESARWLISKGKIEEAKQVFKQIAKQNGRDFPQDLFLSTKMKPSRIIEAKFDGGQARKPGLKDLMTPGSIALRTLNMSYQWFSVTLCFYGITFALTSLSGNPYLNFFLGALCELPGALLGYFCIDFLGRRFILSALQILAGVACLASGLLVLVPELWLLQTILALIGKFGATCVFGTVYLYTSELFPTTMRGTAVGFCSTIARIGGIISLLLGGLRQIWQPFPMVIMGTVGTIAGLLALFLPETTGLVLPETMEEALSIRERNKNFKPFKRSNGQSSDS